MYVDINISLENQTELRSDVHVRLLTVDNENRIRVVVVIRTYRNNHQLPVAKNIGHVLFEKNGQLPVIRKSTIRVGTVERIKSTNCSRRAFSIQTRSAQALKFTIR